MTFAKEAFEERVAEIDEFLDLLQSVDERVRNGGMADSGSLQVSTDQQKILYSSVYLLLYNLIESTISNCLQHIEERVVEESLRPEELSPGLKEEWIKVTAKTHESLNEKNRFSRAQLMFETLVENLELRKFEFRRLNGGNWDDNEIEKVAEKLGCSLNVDQSTYSKVKRTYRNDQGMLEFVKDLRNKLAHGSISFVECGNAATVNELVDLKTVITSYLRDVLDALTAVPVRA